MSLTPESPREPLDLPLTEGTTSAEPVEMVWLLDCGYLDDGEEPHEYPGDWIFGGANKLHPGADPRFETSVYRYLNAYAVVVWSTSQPTCDHEALDQFTFVSRIGDSHPVYIEVRRPGESDFTILPWEYREVSDTFHPLVSVDA